MKGTRLSQICKGNTLIVLFTDLDVMVVYSHIYRHTGPLNVMDLARSKIVGCSEISVLLKWLRCMGQ